MVYVHILITNLCKIIKNKRIIYFYPKYKYKQAVHEYNINVYIAYTVL